LYFPITSTDAVAESTPGTDGPPSAQGRVALLVEDDSLVRAMAVRVLVQAGYTVLEAPQGRAALDLVQRHRGRLDIVITDIGLPEMDGHELGRRLREERPDVPVLYMSGYGDADSVGPLLRKPFAPDVLVHKVNELLG
jgi:CheY-like chemotaxis protein